MPEVFVGRQPIFNRQLKVIGYELLYRASGSHTKATFVDGDDATINVILNSLAEIGLEKIVGNNRAFINLTRNFIIGRYPMTLPPNRMVLEILENIGPDEEVTHGLELLCQRGFPIALDDVRNVADITPLLRYAQIVKLDLSLADRDFLDDEVRQLKRHPVRILAEKVETFEDLNLCLNLGFDLFQGYFLSKPNVIEGQQASPVRVVVLALMARLQNPEVNFTELEELVSSDAVLGYKLLRLANSAYFGVPIKITSIRHAMTMLGLNQLRGWLTLFLLSRLDNKPSELAMQAMLRARFAEQLAVALGRGHVETYFLAGLFSLLDALLDMPIDSLIESLPLSEELIGALIDHTGDLGQVLQAVIAYENAEWDHVALPGLTAADFTENYLNAVAWTNQMNALLAN